MIDVFLTVFWGLVLLTAIVFVHELGHFMAARSFGLRVKEFMIGLPGPKISFKRKDTTYGVTAIPLGGYCLIAGMERGEETDDLEKALAFIAYFGRVKEEDAVRAGEQFGFDLIDNLDTLADWGTVSRHKRKGLTTYAISEAKIHGVRYKEGRTRNIPNLKAFLAAERKLTFNALPWWKRVVILLAGSFTNIIVAFGILIAIVMINGVVGASTTIDSVGEGLPAQEAGLQAGDTLIAIDGKTINNWQGFVDTVRSHEPGDVIEVGYLRDDAEHSVIIVVAESEGNPVIGVISRPERQPVGFFQAAEYSGVLIGSVFDAFLKLFNPSSFSETISQTSSVVGISMEARSAAESGLQNFVLLIAVLCISVGLFNLLPVPPLDGGKIVIETIERVMRRRLSPSIINGISLFGFAMILALFIFSTNADIHRYFLGG